MLLSSYNHNNNNRVMDDFIEQDWFADTEEVINKHSAAADQQSQSPDIGLPGDVQFFQLNVPVDENVYLGNEQQQQQYLVEPPLGHGILQEFDLAQENCVVGTSAISSNNHHIVPPESVQPMVKDPENIQIRQTVEVGGGDFPSTTSNLTLLKSCVPQQISNHLQHIHYPQENQTQWANHHSQPPQPSQYHQMDQNCHQYMNISRDANDFALNSSSIYQHNDQTFQAHVSPMDKSMVHPDPRSILHYPTNTIPIDHSHDNYTNGQQHHMQRVGIETNVVSSSEQIMLNSFTTTTFTQPPSFPIHEKIVTKAAKKPSKPKKKTTIQQSKEPERNGKKPPMTTPQIPESGLDQIAKSLFNDTKTATLKFNEPHLAIEFASLMSRCQQLMEQQNKGMDVSTELKVVEASIADCIMRNASAIASTSTIGETQPLTMPSVTSAVLISSTTPNPNNKKSKSKKKLQPIQKTQPIQSSSNNPIAIASSSTYNLQQPSALQQYSFVSPNQAAYDLPTNQFTSQIHPPLLPDTSCSNVIQSSSIITSAQMQPPQIVQEQLRRDVPSQQQQQPNSLPTMNNNTKSNSKKRRKPTAISQSKSTLGMNINATQTSNDVNLSNLCPNLSTDTTKNADNIDDLKQATSSGQHIVVYQQAINQNEVVTYKEQILPVLVPDKPQTSSIINNKNKKRINRTSAVYSKKSFCVAVKETPEQMNIRLAQQREKRKRRLTEHFEKMSNYIERQDYHSPFTSSLDCIQRLLPFGLFFEPEFNNAFFDRFDDELHRHSELMQERKRNVEQRLRSIFLRQTMTEIKEEQSLILFLDAFFEKEQLQRDITDRDSNIDLTEYMECKSELDWEYNQWDPEHYLNIKPLLSPSIFEPSTSSISIKNEPVELQEQWDEISSIEFLSSEEHEYESHVQRPLDRFADVQICLRPYKTKNAENALKQDFIEEIIALDADDSENSKDEDSGEEPLKESESGSKTIKEETIREVEEILKEEDATLVPQTMDEPNLNIPSTSTIEQFTLEMMAQKMIALMPPIESVKISEERKANVEIKEMIVPIVPEDIVILPYEPMNEEEMKTAKLCQQSASETISESKQIYGSNGKMPVKLKIKIGNDRKPEEGNEIKSKTDADDDDKEERKRRKELKRLRKAAKKAMKLEEKLRKEGAVENGNANDDMAEPTTSQGCGEDKTNGIADTSERFPLKLSLRRIPKREEEIKREEDSKLPNDDSGFGGLLKLRISKQVLSTEYAAAFDERVLETNNNNQNGIETYEEVRNKGDRCKKHRKKEKKHKMVDKPAEMKKMEEEPPKKIPKIKIRFGNGPLVASLGDTSQQSMVPDERKATENAQLLRPNTDTVSIAPTCSTNLNSSSLVDHDAEKQIMSIERRIQFSPCSSDEGSDSELRQRTSQLLSRIDRFL